MAAKGSTRRRRRAELLVALAIVAALLAAALIFDSGSSPEPSPAVAERGSSEAEAAPRSAARAEPRRPEIRAEARETGGGERGAGEIRWRRSQPVGDHAAGRLRRGVLLPAEGREWVSWDPIEKQRPNREWRRWGSDRLVRTVLNVLREFGRDHPRAPRVAVGDLSRPQGGDFGPQFGSIGHASHQNGLDVDIYYPREDSRVRPPKRPGQVDLRFAQELVDRFLEVDPEKIFVGPSLGLEGPSDVVVPLVNHDNHLHVRLPLS